MELPFKLIYRDNVFLLTGSLRFFGMTSKEKSQNKQVSATNDRCIYYYY